MLNDSTIQIAKTTGDVAAASLTVATLLSWLPHIAAGLSILWMLVRFYEHLSQRPLHEVGWIRKLFGCHG